MKYRIKHLVEYGLLRGVAGLVTALPYRAALALGWLFAALGWFLARRRTREAERRIVSVLHCPPRRAARIAWTAWRNLFFNGVELLRFPRLTLDWVKRHIAHDDVYAFLDYLKAGRGTVLAVPHMGNWDLAGVAGGLFGVPIFFMARRQRNPLLDAYLNRMRGHTGIETVLTDAGMLRHCLRKLEDGKVLAILPDVRARTAAVSVDFLGGTANIGRGMALFARQACLPIQPAYVYRIGWTRHVWVIPEMIHPDPALEKDADVDRMTQAVMRLLDQAIHEHPEQYFWFNKRWVLEPLDLPPPSAAAAPPAA